MLVKKEEYYKKLSSFCKLITKFAAIKTFYYYE